MAEPVCRRCGWVHGALMEAYHDQEWGRPLHDDARLYEMLFLEGFQADWVEAARQRWSEELRQCRALLAENFAHHGKHILAVEVWKRVLQCDNCSEEGYRGLFQAYRALGRQADALRLWQSCRQAYAEELDLEPPEEFEQLSRF